MKISYLFNASIPSNLPSSLQVAKMCEGMRKVVNEVNLITPMPGLKTKYLNDFYNIKTEFNFHKIKYFKKYPMGINYYLFSLVSILYLFLFVKISVIHFPLYFKPLTDSLNLNFPPLFFTMPFILS